MRLRARLDKLTPAAIAAWRASWERFAVLCDEHRHPAVEARIHEAIAKREELPEDDDAFARLPKAAKLELIAREAEKIAGALEGVPLHGLDLHALCAWSFLLPDLPDPDAKDLELSLTPHRLPMPPEEPPSVFEELLAVLADEGMKGEAAACIASALGLARAVRECCELKAPH